MNSLYQLVGLTAIAVGLAGTWTAARRRSGWLLCITSSAMWLPALVTGEQWAAVLNCGLSVAICLRNFRTQADRPADLVPVADPPDAESAGSVIPAQRSIVAAGAS